MPFGKPLENILRINTEEYVELSVHLSDELKDNPLVAVGYFLTLTVRRGDRIDEVQQAILLPSIAVISLVQYSNSSV